MKAKEKTQIELWKEEHGKLFQSIIDSKEYIWRRVNRKEYSEIMSLMIGEELEDRIYERQKAIVKLTVLNIDEEELDGAFEELAGLAQTFSEEILDKSGFYITRTVEL